jgi:hypothetical protein
MKQYITKIFRFYVARAYAAFSAMWVNYAPLPRAHDLACIVPHFANSREGVQAVGNDIYNPFGHAPNDPPGPMLNFRRTNQHLICPECRHYLDQEIPPNSESSHCFMGYFQRHNIEYPQLVPRYTFMNDDNLNGHGPMYKVVREVAHFDPQIRDRTDTQFFYDMPGHEHVNNYFELPQIRAYYALHQHDGDNALWYGIPREERDAINAAHHAVIAQVEPAVPQLAPIIAVPHAVIAPVEPAMPQLDIRPRDPFIHAVNPIKVTEFYRLFNYATLRAAMTDARHCFEIEGVDEDNQDKCTICTELLDDPGYDPTNIAVSGCFHLFHKKCIDDYINDKFRNILAIRADALRQVAEAELLLNQPFGRIGQFTELFNCPFCRRLLDQQPDVDDQKARCFKNYLHRMHIPYPNLLDRVQLRGRDIYRDYAVAPITLPDEGYRVLFRNLHVLRPEYVRNAEGVDVLQPIRHVRTNNYNVHVDEDGIFRNDQLDHVDFWGNPADPPTVYMTLHDPHFSERYPTRKYYDQYPERNKYMDIVYQDYVLLQPVPVHIIGEGPLVPMPEELPVVREPEGVVPMREELPAVREPEEALAAIPEAPPVVLMPDAPPVGPMPDAPPVILPICRDGRSRGRNPQMDLTVESAKNLASQNGLSNRGSKADLCNRLIGHVPPLARRPYADEGRRTKRKRRTRKNKRRSKH